MMSVQVSSRKSLSWLTMSTVRSSEDGAPAEDEDEEDEADEDADMYDREISGRQQLDDDAEKIQATRLQKELKTAKGSARNMRDMLDKLRGKIKCR